jgi:hypothetical protein
VTPLDQQYDIAGSENTAFEVALIRIVKINLEPRLAYEKHLLGQLNLPRHGIVDVRSDQLPRGMAHEGQLLGKLIRSEKMDARLTETIGQYQCQKPIFTSNFLDHFGTPDQLSRGVQLSGRVRVKYEIRKLQRLSDTQK